MQTDLLCGDEQRWERLERLSIARLQTFEPPEGYILAYSGGKDSDVLLSLAKAAGVRFEAHYHATTIDPPEVVRHVLTHPEVTLDRPAKSFIRLMATNGLPTVGGRWCCKLLKERAFPGRVVLTGMRAAESPRRAKRSMVEAARQGHGQRFVHPLFDWSDADVWGYLRARGVVVCDLYGQGHKRIGCVCCPMGSTQERDAKRWPHIVEAIHRAWLRYHAAHPTCGIRDAEDFWRAWVSGKAGRQGKDLGCPIFADARDEP